MHEPGSDSLNVDPLIGKVLAGRFTLNKLIARGGLGKVYEATQQPLGRTVALKILDIHTQQLRRLCQRIYQVQLLLGEYGKASGGCRSRNDQRFAKCFGESFCR